MKVPLSENRLVTLALAGIVLTAGVTAVLATPGLLGDDAGTTDAEALEDGPPANDSFTPAQQTQSGYEEDEYEDEGGEYHEDEEYEDDGDDYEDDHEDEEHEDEYEDDHEDEEYEDGEEYADQTSVADDTQLVVGGTVGVPSA